jgi:segregation and condensation protein A
MNCPQLQRFSATESIAEPPSQIHGNLLITHRLFRAAPAARWRRRIRPSARCGRWPKRASLERLIGMTEAEDWSCLDDYLLSYVVDPSQRATVFASSFAAALEMVREGEMELNQKEAFAPLYFRKRPPQAAMPAPDMTVE